LRLKAHDLLAITMAGAYGFSMCSNYNSRTRPPEILVDGDRCLLIRRRETAKDLIAFEKPYLKDRKRVKANLNCTSEPRP
jgi:diaminopimelate decarboxylase